MADLSPSSWSAKADHPRVSFHGLMLAAFAFIGLVTLTHPTQAEEKKSLTPLPSLNTVEECQRADHGRYFGKTVRFHHGACWADVSIDEDGKITSFIPEDVDACKKALRVNCGWID